MNRLSESEGIFKIDKDKMFEKNAITYCSRKICGGDLRKLFLVCKTAIG